MNRRAFLPALLAGTLLLAPVSRAEVEDREFSGLAFALFFVKIFDYKSPYDYKAGGVRSKAESFRGGGEVENISFSAGTTTWSMDGADPSGTAGTLLGAMTTTNGKTYKLSQPAGGEDLDTFHAWVEDAVFGNSGVTLSLDEATLKGTARDGRDGASVKVSLKITYSGTSTSGPKVGGKNKGWFKVKGTLAEIVPG